MKKFILFGTVCLSAIGLWALAFPVSAQNSMNSLCVTTNGHNCIPVTTTNPLPTSATLSAASLTASATATAANPSYSEGTANALSQDLSGHLRVGATQTTSPWVVSGTVSATQGTSPWVTTISGNTLPVTQGTSPWIVSGSGTAGTAASGVVTVQGITSMTPVQVSQATAGNLNATAVLAAGSATVGSVKLTDGTNTAVLNACQSVTISSTTINIASATTTRIVAPTSAKHTYVCGLYLLSAGTNNVAVVEGTGGTCGSSTAGVIGGATAISGNQLTAQVGFVLPNTGYAQAITNGTNVDLCLITSTNTQLSGVITWAQQ